MHNYAWGFGHNTNTQAEVLALLQGLKKIKKVGINEENVIGDSKSIIKIIVENFVPKDLRLARLVTRIKILLNLFKV